MIVFDRLQISDNGSRLNIDVHVNMASYFDNVYIDKVVIQTQDQVSEMDPLTPGDEYIYELTADENTKELHLSLNASTDFETVMSTLSDKLLFVYVVCKGLTDPCTPCRLDELTTLGVTFDEALFYQQVMQYTRQLADSCEIPKNFIDMILLWNGFRAAIETEHYLVAIDFWKKLFASDSVFTVIKSCGCYG